MRRPASSESALAGRADIQAIRTVCQLRHLSQRHARWRRVPRARNTRYSSCSRGFCFAMYFVGCMQRTNTSRSRTRASKSCTWCWSAREPSPRHAVHEVAELASISDRLVVLAACKRRFRRRWTAHQGHPTAAQAAGSVAGFVPTRAPVAPSLGGSPDGKGWLRCLQFSGTAPRGHEWSSLPMPFTFHGVRADVWGQRAQDKMIAFGEAKTLSTDIDTSPLAASWKCWARPG